MSDNPCPLCGKPILDTAYVCHRCVTVLADDLREAARQWPYLEAAVAQQSVVAAAPIGRKPRLIDRRVHSGPWCWGASCQHDSCRLIWRSIITQRIEPPLPNEASSIINLHAAEHAAIITNTATTWARHVSEERGTPLPRPRLRLTPTPTPDPHDDDRPQRCHWSDLPLDQCACGHHQESA